MGGINGLHASAKTDSSGLRSDRRVAICDSVRELYTHVRGVRGPARSLPRISAAGRIGPGVHVSGAGCRLAREVTLVALITAVSLLVLARAGEAGAAALDIAPGGAAPVALASEDVSPAPTPDRSWMDRYRGRKVSRIRTTQRAVALTFDDGPNKRTRSAVDILDAYGAKGTFFATWWCSRHPANAVANRYVVSRGHELANHTTRHKPLTRSYRADVTEIMGIERMLVEQTGSPTIWVRAMGGSVNKTGLRATRDTGHLYAQWSVDSMDARRRYTAPTRLYRNVVRRIRPGDIVLMHVTHPETLAALPLICAELQRQGYRMVTLSELAAAGSP
jgi:peptidoglycan/xylan/chitin deacetylase (PgdA/CDA1 family)